MIQESERAAEAYDDDSETIIVEHGDGGTRVEISEPSGAEILALALLVLGVIALAVLASRPRRR